MRNQELKIILENVNRYRESDWIERKHNFADKEKIAETISALANSACIKKKSFAYMIWGIEDKTKQIIGTNLNICDKKITGKGKKHGINLWQRINNTFKSQIQIELLETNYYGNRIFAIKIQSAQSGKPVIYKDIPYIRINANGDTYNDNGNNHPHLIKQIYNSNFDITGGLTKLTINELDKDALIKFKSILLTNTNNQKYKNMNDQEILRRLNILSDGYITYGGALLLAKEEFSYELFSDKGKITRKYEDKKNNEILRNDWNIPFILYFDEIVSEIQRFNTSIQEINLFRRELKKYETKAIRELIFNSIVHRDWSINKWIEIYQSPKNIIFINPGMFIANLNDVLKDNKRPDYRNPNLSNIFKSLNYIEKEGGGLRDVYSLQLSKGLKINTYFDIEQTKFELLGYIKDIEFAKSIMQYTDIEPFHLMLLDKIVSGQNSLGKDIDISDGKELEKLGYVEIYGKRYKKLNLSKKLADVSKKQGIRTRIQGVDKNFYEQHIIDHIKKNNKIYYYEVKDICKGKNDQFCSNLLYSMKKKGKLELIKPQNTRRERRYYILNKER